MSNRKTLVRIVLAMAVGGLISGPVFAGTTLECTDDTRELHEFVSDQATAPPGETNAAPLEALTEGPLAAGVTPEVRPAQAPRRAEQVKGRADGGIGI